MHNQGIVHGGLRGVRSESCCPCSARSSPNRKANILINHAGHACLAGFSLLTIASDQPTTPSVVTGDAIRWMSPELINPSKFNLEEGRPTKRSDCYALGMVIYEVLSGRVPFSPGEDTTIVSKVMEGERPRRPQGREGARFTDSLWEMLGGCWKDQPDDRPSLDAVLGCLQAGGKLPARPRWGWAGKLLNKALKFTAGKPHRS